MTKCVFAGSFDPFTAGHYSTVQNCLALFDEVVIAVAENRNKTYFFSARERVQMVKAAFSEEKRVRVILWEKTIVDLLEKEDTRFYVRGIRNTIDLEYENADFYASRKLDESMITLYIPSEQNLTHISSTLVKNCIAFGKPYKEYVPEAVYDYIQNREGK